MGCTNSFAHGSHEPLCFGVGLGPIWHDLLVDKSLLIAVLPKVCPTERGSIVSLDGLGDTMGSQYAVKLGDNRSSRGALDNLYFWIP